MIPSLSPGAIGGARAFELPVPTLDLNYAGNNAFLNSESFTRPSLATMFDSTGRLTYCPNNLAVRSEEFESGSWSKGGASVTADAVAPPLAGISAADFLNENTNDVRHIVQQTNILAPGRYSISVYVKANGRTAVTIGGGRNVGSGTYATASFNLTGDGSVAQSAASGTGYAVIATTITALGDGWYRCGVVVNLPENQSNLLIGTSDGGNIGAYGLAAFTGVPGLGVYIWGAQAERVTYETLPRAYNPTTTAAYYGPRFDYDPVTLQGRGLLVEGARTNLLLRSEEFENGAWTVDNVSCVANTVVAPDGLTTAETITSAASVANNGFWYTSGGSIAAATIATFSLYVKKSTHRYVALTFNGGGAGNNCSAVFDLDGGGSTATQTGAQGASSSVVSTAMQPVGNGWFRLSLTGNVTIGTIRFPSFAMAVGATGNTFHIGGAPQLSGFTGAESAYVWGAQLEAGNHASSYIPTTTAAVTRAADASSRTFPEYNDGEGTFLVEYSMNSALGDGSNSSIIQAYNQSTPSTEVDLLRGGNNAKGLWVGVGGASVFSNFSGSYQPGVVNRAAFVIKSSDFALTRDGVIIATQASGTAPTGITHLSIGSHVIGRQMGGHVRRIRYYNTRVSNRVLKALTAEPA